MSQRHPVWVAENHVNPCNSVHINLLHIITQEALKDAICTYATKTEEYIFASSAHYGIIFDIGSKTGFQLSGYVG